MALTPAQINAIKRYLGYDLIAEDAWHGAGAMGLDRNLERLDADAVTAVEGVLAELAAVDASITAARGRLKASQVGNLTLNHGEIRTLRQERTTLTDELARMLGVTPPADGCGQVIV